MNPKIIRNGKILYATFSKDGRIIRSGLALERPEREPGEVHIIEHYIRRIDSNDDNVLEKLMSDLDQIDNLPDNQRERFLKIAHFYLG